MCARIERAAVAAGFSLIEMLVALAVFALVVLALLNLAGESTRTAAHVEERILAGIVADNLAAEAMLAEPGQLSAPASGTAQLGDRAWRWTRETGAAQGGLLRVDIQVSGSDGAVVASAWVFR